MKKFSQKKKFIFLKVTWKNAVLSENTAIKVEIKLKIFKRYFTFKEENLAALVFQMCLWQFQ